MSKIINLLNFRLTRLHLDQNPLEKDVVDRDATFETGYDIRTSKEKPDQFLMILTIKGTMGAEKGHLLGPVFEAVGVGEFKVPSDLSPEIKVALVAINGGSILYGLLRGHLAMVTGSFPSGMVLLPTLNWQETVQEIEKKRAAAQQSVSQKTRIVKEASHVTGKGGAQKQRTGAKRKATTKKPSKRGSKKTAAKSRK